MWASCVLSSFHWMLFAYLRSIFLQASVAESLSVAQEDEQRFALRRLCAGGLAVAFRAGSGRSLLCRWGLCMHGVQKMSSGREEKRPWAGGSSPTAP